MMPKLIRQNRFTYFNGARYDVHVYTVPRVLTDVLVFVSQGDDDSTARMFGYTNRRQSSWQRAFREQGRVTS